MKESLNIQFGCGLCAPDGWTNFDSSPTLMLQRIPLAGALFRGRSFPPFPRNVMPGDIAKGLDYRPGKADRLYCSHVLEHLSLNDFRSAIAETYRLLKPEGVFRLVLPDFEYYVRNYIESSSSDRVIEFMEGTILGVKERSRSVFSLLRERFGGSKHLWMWDYRGIEFELRRVGYQTVRRATFGDSGDSVFALVEDEGRWSNALGVECRK